MRSCLPRIERARPLLGTRVSIRVEGLGEQDAHRAIDEAFDEIATIHRLMSFHEADSEVSRLNREACEQGVVVDSRTYEVLTCAQAMSHASDGCFDVTIGGELVGCETLPRPDSKHAPDARATWRDIVLGKDGCVRFRTPLWIDLGGIAKGYAVDRAVEKLKACGAVQLCVNAGGDLRIQGPAAERVLLQAGQILGGNVPMLEIADAAIASSGGNLDAGRAHGPHFDGRNRSGIAAGRFVSVVAESCMVADALTKIALALGEDSAPILESFGASAHLHDPRLGWLHIGAP